MAVCRNRFSLQDNPVLSRLGHGTSHVVVHRARRGPVPNSVLVMLREGDSPLGATLEILADP